MCIICTEEYKIIIDLTIVNCYGCKNVKAIPVIPGLEILNCSWCPNLTKIPAIPGLEELYCSDCPNLTKIPTIPGLQRLDCSDCTSLTKIPIISGLQKLNCSNCTSLTKIPVVPLKRLRCFGCPWLSQNSEFADNLKKLTFLQTKIRRRYAGKKLEALVPQISEIYYSPGCKGYELAKRSFYSASL